MTIEEMIKRKTELGYSNKTLSERSGVPEATIQKIFSGSTKAPRRETILALEKVLKPAATYDYDFSAIGASIAEAALKYGAELPKDAPRKRQGDYTIEDYYALPDDQRAELIDGVLYNMSSPTQPHQIVVAQVSYQLMQCAEEHDSDCEIFLAPLDVQLDKDAYTMLQPDILIVCDMENQKHLAIYGAPDFVLEVLSPSTKKKDMVIKLNKYLYAGCKEYWIVDPDKLTVTVYYFEEDEICIPYTFDDTVPLRISGGKCEIDFSKIKKRLARYR